MKNRQLLPVVLVGVFSFLAGTGASSLILRVFPVQRPPLRAVPNVWAATDSADQRSTESRKILQAGYEKNIAPLDSGNVPAESASEFMRSRSETAERIRRYFPDLQASVMEGWVDAYQSVPDSELTQLLQSKRELSDILTPSLSIAPAGSMSEGQLHTVSIEDSSEPADRIQLTGTKTDAVSAAIAAVDQNMRCLLTPGYRRSEVLTFPVSPASGAKCSVRIETVRSFRRGSVEPSVSPFHLAIDGGSSLMFCLQPGNVLTRCGRFDRSEDGHLQLQTPSGTTLTLAPDICIPDNVIRLDVLRSGEVRADTEDGQQLNLGDLQLARVGRLDQLSSADGVFFHCKEPQTIEMIRAGCIRSGHLERSNVVVARERRLRRHLEDFRADLPH